MPNWCENQLYLEASPDEIRAIIVAAATGGLLDHMCPQPDILDPQPGSIMPDWWHWRKANWGTKWDVEVKILSHSDDEGWINLQFDSAWSPPLEAVKHWQSQAPGRSFQLRYVEWGNCFCGLADSGSEPEFYNIPATAAKVRKTIPLDLDETFGIAETVAQWED